MRVSEASDRVNSRQNDKHAKKGKNGRSGTGADLGVFAQPLEKVKVLSTAQQKFELTVSGIHWDELDEDISVAGLLAGRGDATHSTKIAA